MPPALCQLCQLCQPCRRRQPRRAAALAAGRRPLALTGLLVLASAALPWTLPAADRLELDDGRSLSGDFLPLPGVGADPLAVRNPDRSTPVVMVDDGLTRSFVPRRRVRTIVPSPPGVAEERIEVPQMVATAGRQITAIGGVLETTPFDEWGRRIFSVATASGRLDIVQGVTEITPRYTRLEGVQTERPVQMDMRIATSSIPRDQLSAVLDHLLDEDNPDARLRVVRLYLQAGRFADARGELDAILERFPDLEHLDEEQAGLARLADRHLLDEITRRATAGQHRLAMRLLEEFPSEGADGVTLEEVRERRDRYAEQIQRGRDIVADLGRRAKSLADGEQRAAAGRFVEELTGRLSFATLGRLATYERLAGRLPDDRAVAMAINGWLAGASAADDNLKTALSAMRVRDGIGEFLRSDSMPRRREIFEQLSREEAFDATTVAGIARQMAPPLAAPQPIGPGLYRIEAETMPGEGAVRCLVQLPPEYDPLDPRPAIVSLHASWSTPRNQIEWWAGLPDGDGPPGGQAMRHGCIVIAPAWAEPHQRAYGFTAREHAAVLASLRAACRHFAIDTDRVFLSGHSLGGDAAWDIALAHPDLWAGLVAVVPTAAKYVNHYWTNAENLPLYFVGGELDAGRLQANAMDLDRYLRRGFDATYVEYLGRGHEHFSDEILRIFAWMELRRRPAPPDTIDVVSMRPWDRFFWWLEADGLPRRTMLEPAHWPPDGSFRPLAIRGQRTAGDAFVIRTGSERTTVWLTPDLVDFREEITVSIDGRRVFRGVPRPDLWTMLEDLRLRADRQHPFWCGIDNDGPLKPGP